MIPENEINISSIERLIKNSVPESKTIDYKRDLSDDEKDGKTEFLKDVSAFANTIGGDLIYGVKSDKGIPVGIIGLNINNPDDKILSLTNLIRDGLEPKLIGTEIIPIPYETNNYVIVVRVKKSWCAPHRVIFNKHMRFYGRDTSSNYPMDVSDLRIAFTLSETIGERIRKFINNRISCINNSETPIPLNQGGKILLHLIPLSAFTTRETIKIDKNNQPNITNIQTFVTKCRLNIDGLVKSVDKQEYTQLYRSGIIENVLCIKLRPGTENSCTKVFDGSGHEKCLLAGLQSHLEYLKNLGMATPVYLYLNFIDVKDYQIVDSNDRFGTSYENGMPIDRDDLKLPEIVIDSFDTDIDEQFKLLFNLVWEACNISR